MKSWWMVIGFAIAAATTSSAESLAPAAAVSSPRRARGGNFGVELLGRGGLYSVQYDHAVSDQVSVGGGLELVPLPFGPDPGLIVGVPVYSNLYFRKAASGPFLTGGATLFASVTEGEGEVVPMAGVGYELRKKNGRTVRLALYLARSGGRIPVVGPMVGIAFGRR